MNKYGLSMLFVLVMASSLFASVIINTKSGIDIASGMFYSYVANESYYVLTTPTTLTSFAKTVGDDGKGVNVYTASNPMSTNLNSELQANGLTVTTNTYTNSYELNLNLANKAIEKGAKMLILTDPSYSYNLVVLTTYANFKGAYVLYINDESYVQQVDLIKNSNLPVMVYGMLGEKTISQLETSGITYTSINNNDKYKDNIELVNNYYEEGGDRKSVIFTDGTLFEASINNGIEPVVLIAQVLPEVTVQGMKDLVKTYDIKHSTLIGEQYAGAVTELKRQINTEMGEDVFSAWLKAKRSSGTELVPLDVFILESVNPDVKIQSVNYNTETNKLEITYVNSGNVPAFVQGDHELLVGNVSFKTIGDSVPFTVAKNEVKGVSYDVEAPSDQEGELKLSSIVRYGISQTALDRGFRAEYIVGKVDFVDDSKLEIASAIYNLNSHVLSVNLNNEGENDVYLRINLEYTVAGVQYLFEDERNLVANKESTKVIQVSDFIENDTALEKMQVNVVYGGREGFLLNEVSKNVEITKFEEKQESTMDFNLILIAILVLLFLVIIFLLMKKK